MPHPTEEEWIAYLYGESDEASAARLAAHLSSCEECRAKIAAWRRVMGELDRWSLPDKRPAATWPGRAARWAAAALLLVALGYGIGLGSAQLLAPGGADAERAMVQLERSLRSGLETRIGQKLREELGADVRIALAATRDDLHRDLSRDLRSGISELAASSVAASGLVARGLLADFLRTYDAARNAEGRALLTLLAQMESKRIEDREMLRNDVATLASFTGDMARLFASGRARQPASYTPNRHESESEERRQK